MSHQKNTRRHVIDYMLLAGKSKPLVGKQNSMQKENLKSEMPVEEKYASPGVRKTNLRGEISSQNTMLLEKNTSSQLSSVKESAEVEGNNMVSLEHDNDNNEAIKNKVVHRQILGNVKDNKTGSMMLVVLEQMVDGTKSKMTGKKVSHMPSMVVDGVNVFNLSMDIDNNQNSIIAGKTKKTRSQRAQKKIVAKVDSDLEILAWLSGDSDGQKFQKSSMGYLEQNVDLDMNLKTTVESSEDDLDSDLDKCRIILATNSLEKKRVETVIRKG